MREVQALAAVAPSQDVGENGDVLALAPREAQQTCVAWVVRVDAVMVLN